MHLLFVADPIESFVIYKDTTFAMMREAQARGYRISVCEPADLSWVAHSQSGQQLVTADVRDITLTGEKPQWFRAEQQGSERRVEEAVDGGRLALGEPLPGRRSVVARVVCCHQVWFFQEATLGRLRG